MDQFSVPSRMKNLFHGTAPAQSGDYGLHVLVDKAAEGEGMVGIVAVHGLNGHYKNTWTATRPNRDLVNWLRNVLPRQEVIRTRVMLPRPVPSSLSRISHLASSARRAEP